jgi:lytic murein transglycosylase
MAESATGWMLRRAGLALLCAVAFGAGDTAQAQRAACHGGASFERWLSDFKQEARGKGISQRTLSMAAPHLTFDPGVVRRDRGQGVFQQSFLQFAGRMVNSRMAAGNAQMRRQAALLQRIERDFGVPGAAVVAFWGLETDFGANTGNLSVLRSLATLAYDCRRADFFREELLSGLRLVERGDLTPDEMVGAWAGEIGQTQFSTSSYYKYALDYDGDGRRDLIRSTPDALGSSANLLAKAGKWRRGEPWLQEVRVPERMAWEEADLAVTHPRSQWAQWGVQLANGRALPNDSLQASLLLPMGRLGPAFLAYHNFHAFLEWNQSMVYATTAAYYATRLAGAPEVRRGRNPPPAPTAKQVDELQRLLTQRGFKPGKIDGRLGVITRAAVKQAQLKYGLPADSYPTPELMERLRRGR